MTEYIISSCNLAPLSD